MTGMSFNNAQLVPKRLDLLRELVPHAKLFGYLDNVATASDVVRKELVERARSIGREVIGFYASTEQEIESTFDAIVRQGVVRLVLSPTPTQSRDASSLSPSRSSMRCLLFTKRAIPSEPG